LLSSSVLMPADPASVAFYFFCHTVHSGLHSFPTRRSSDLMFDEQETPRMVFYIENGTAKLSKLGAYGKEQILRFIKDGDMIGYRDRKSTRLNSSHVKTSYAVYCLKKKKPKSFDHSDRKSTH